MTQFEITNLPPIVPTSFPSSSIDDTEDAKRLAFSAARVKSIEEIAQEKEKAAELLSAINKKVSDEKDDLSFVRSELVVDKGKVRQAGATMSEGEWVNRFRRRAEQSLFIFLKGILGRHFLTPHFHRSVCEFIQQIPPARKLVLMPREHAKTAIISGGLPPHILIQPSSSNIYFPGIEGSECRILMCGETEAMAKKNLRVVSSIFEENKVFRAFWPSRVWETSKNAKQWSSEAIIIPRSNEWPDPTIRAVGVGGAITGARPNVLIKDDLVSLNAANSEVVMDGAIEWHRTSRALLDTYEVESGLQSLEFIIGTRWAVFDLYSYIIDNDQSVEVIDSKFHQIISDGNILWPEKHTLASIDQLRLEYGSLFYLLYMNSAANPELTDFDLSLLRYFSSNQSSDTIEFESDPRDTVIQSRIKKLYGGEPEKPPEQLRRGTPMSSSLLDRLSQRHGIRFRS